MFQNRQILSMTLACIMSLGMSAGHAQSATLDSSVVNEIDDAVASAMQNGNIPSIAIAVVSKEAILLENAYGYANLRKKVEADVNTVYLIGSTFKPQSTYALLQLVDEGKIKLDDPVRKFLGDIPIRNEFEDTPVRIKHLLTHASGLAGDFGQHFVWGFTAPLSMEDYLRKNLEVSRPPEEKYEYSNMAYQLIGYIIERVSGKPYRNYIQQEVWGRMGMGTATFVPSPRHYEHMSIPYLYNEKKNTHTPATRVKADVWAAGNVYSTVGDQARWLMTNLNGGEYKGDRLISKRSFKSMMKPQFHTSEMSFHGLLNDTEAAIGYTWWIKESEGDRTFTHSGSVPGYTAWISGNLDKGVGVVILTNGNRAHVHLATLAETVRKLVEE